MKIFPLIAGIFLASCSNAQQMNNTAFTAERITQTASILLNDRVDKVFPLFGAFEERKWAKGWNPALIYPQKEVIEEGTTFRTPGHVHDESELLWTVSKYDQARFLIQYLVYAENRILTITITCSPVSDHTTSAEITYSFTGLTEMGNQIDQHLLHAIYRHDLSDWAEDINHYLGGPR